MASVPTRELKIGAIIDKTFSVLERAAVPALLFLVALSAVGGVIDYFTANASPLSQLAATPLRVVIGVFFAYLLLGAMVQRTGLRTRGDKDVFLTYFGLSVLYGLAVALGLVLLVLPALFLLARWSLAQPLVVARGEGVMKAFGESWERTSGNEFSIIVALLLLWLLPIALSIITGAMLPKDSLVGIAVKEVFQSAGSLTSLAMDVALYGMIIGLPKAAARSAE